MERAKAQNQAVALERKIRAPRNRRSNWTGDRQTLHEISSLIQLRHRGPCDTDDGEVYLRAALPWIIAKAGGFLAEDLEARVANWCRASVPRLDRIAIRECIAEAHERDGRQRLWWSAQELGDLLRVTTDERERSRITRIRPAGMTSRKFAAYQKGREAMKAKARRIAKGATPREQSKAVLEPWAALGLSRATYFRRQQAGTLPAQIRDRETVSSAAGTKYLQLATDRSHASERTVPGPARTTRLSRSVGANGHAPGGKTRVVRLGHARALPLPEGGVSEHPDLLGGGEWRHVNDVLTAFEGGVLPDALKRAVRDAQRVRHMTQQAVAQQIGISRPQLANALQGRFGLSRSAAANLLTWLAA
ncbi:helix-turn-helix domain-containing protein [Methylobacterium sp. E-065]|uniref:helix-turn-helix domain-containing protein n=1 Tax=Methylobacterium sp. E-065 TaxID=2836583 RepID=UPI001FB9E750|nr:helix-turn-helix domain-containing protein [Methylobacterium sp. E-065]